MSSHFSSFLRAVEAAVGPDASTHVARARGEVSSGGTGSHRDDRLLVALEHKLGMAGARVPELNASVLGARHDPLGVGSQGHGENEVLKIYS